MKIVVCLSVRVVIISKLDTDFFQILVVASPGPYARTFFFNFGKKKFLIFYEYFLFSLTWDPMGAKMSKRYSSYKSQPNVLKFVLNFSLLFLKIFFQK